MLKITVPESEVYLPSTNEFVQIKETNLQLEHSLVSISKWESKFCKPFMSKDPKTTEELLYYIKCMTINPNVDSNCYLGLTESNIKDIKNYIQSPMTATTFSKHGSSTPSREIVTSELIYYYMIALGIPFECQKWHINRLMTLIKVCNIKNSPPKKMSKSAIMAQNRELNAARRNALHTRG